MYIAFTFRYTLPLVREHTTYNWTNMYLDWLSRPQQGLLSLTEDASFPFLDLHCTV